MIQKFASVFFALAMIVSLTACGNAQTDPAPTNPDTAQTEDAASQATDAEKPSADQPITCFKSFAYKTPEDADYSEITLLYREESEYVATISGTIQVPKSSEAYQGALEKNTAFEETVKSLGLPEDTMWFLHSYVNLESGYTAGSFTFAQLDASNSANVPMVAEYIGFPTDNGYLKLSQCEEFLLDCGFVLTHDA